MLFNSIEYIVFFPLVFSLYWLLQKCPNWQNVFLLGASYIFYAWWDWRFLGLLVGMSLISWLAGKLLSDSRKRGVHSLTRKWVMWMAIGLDLSVLVFFKYYNFFVESFGNLFSLNTQNSSLNLILPLGISFFTFQAISYVVDAYKNKLQTIDNQSNADSLAECLLYIGFFPKLLAGPIERPTHFIPQLREKRVFTYEQAVDGCRQFLWGLFKKIVIADNCALFVDAVYLDYASQSGSTLLLAALFYSIQIYGDFSGYSDMAIGSAKLLGFRFRDNFLFPYFSRNVGEFWKRWHISLNTWFVDYVYIPMGGNREGKVKTIINTMVIFLLSGLWHGADWSFVAWGGYHGLLLVILILCGWNTKYKEVVADKRKFPSLTEFGQMVMVFVLATFGWMMFRAESFGIFCEYLRQMLSTSLISIPDIAGQNFLMLNIVLMFVVEWISRHGKHGLDLVIVRRTWIRYAIYFGVLFDIFCFGGHTENFIYMYF